MTRIINILATESIAKEYVQQPIEFYLAHKILEHPDIFKKVAKNNKSYKIVDCSACELGTGVSMKKVLEAAKIIRANEIVLPDKVKDDNSLVTSLQALKQLNSKQLNRYRIAIVIQGSSIRNAISTIHNLCKSDYIKLIDTIMIPKWFSTSARVILTTEVRRWAPHKNIHWLGLGDDIGYCITKAKDLAIRSLDTGYFLSVAQDKMTNVCKEIRNKNHTIDLEHNKLKQSQIQTVINITNSFDYKYSQSVTNKQADEEFAARMIVVVSLLLIILFIAILHIIKIL